MRFSLKMPKGILTLASLSALLVAAMIAGCDSPAGPNMNDSDTKTASEGRSKEIAAEDARISEAAKKRGGAKAPELRSIKGNTKLQETK